MEHPEYNTEKDKGSLLKRKDFLGVDQNANSHPNRTYYYRKHVDLDEVILTCSKKLQMDPYNIKALYLRGTSFFKKRIYAKALEDFSNVLRNEPNHVETLYYRGMTYSKIENQDKAIQDLSQVLLINPDHVNAAFARAACFNTIGQFSQAIEDYNFALLKDQNPLSREDNKGSAAVSPFSPFTMSVGEDSIPIFSPVRNNYSNTSPVVSSAFTKKNVSPASSTIVSKAGPTIAPFTPVSRQNGNSNNNNFNKNDNSDGATISGQSAASVAPSTAKPRTAKSIAADEHHTRGYQLRRNGDFEGAIAAYTQAIAIDNEHFKAFFNRGFAHDKLNQFDKAVADYSRSIEIDSQNAFAYYNRGISLDRMGSLESALLDFSRAIELQPNTADFYHNRAFCHRKLEKFREAIEDYSQSLKFVPTHFKALFNRGCCYEQVGEIQLALNDYTKALEVQSNHVGCLMNRAAIYDKLDQPEEALKDYTQALVYGGDPYTVFSGRSKVLSKLGRFSEAVQDITAALLSKPQPVDGNLLYARAMCYQSLEEFVKAIDDFSASINVIPTNANAFNNRAYCYRKLEKYEAAIADYNRSIRIQPDNVRAYNNRAYIYAKLNKFEEAVEDYSMVIQLNPTNSHAYHNRGISYDKMGLFDQAIADFTKVLEFDSSSPTNVPTMSKEAFMAGQPPDEPNVSQSREGPIGSPRPIQGSKAPFSPARTVTPTAIRATTPTNVNSAAPASQFKVVNGTFHAPRSALTKASPEDIKKYGVNSTNTASMAPSSSNSGLRGNASPSALRVNRNPAPANNNLVLKPSTVLTPSVVTKPVSPVMGQRSAPQSSDDITQRLTRVDGILQESNPVNNNAGGSLAAVAARLAERRSKTPTSVTIAARNNEGNDLPNPPIPVQSVKPFSSGPNGDHQMSVKTFLSSSGGFPVATAPVVNTPAVPPVAVPQKQSKWLTKSQENATSTNNGGSMVPPVPTPSLVLQPQTVKPVGAVPIAASSGPINAALFLSNLKQQQQSSTPSTNPPTHQGFPSNPSYSTSNVDEASSGALLISAAKGKFSQPAMYSGVR